MFAPLLSPEKKIFDFKCTFANEAAGQVLPHLRELDAKLSDTRLGSEAASLTDLLAEVVSLQEKRDLTVRLARAAGPPMWLIARAAPMGSEAVVTFSDITEERALRAEHARQGGILNSVYEQAPFAACVIGGSPPSFEFANEAFLELIGYDDLAQLLESDVLAQSKSDNQVVALLLRAHETAQPNVLPEYLWQRSDGTTRYLRLLAQPVEETPGASTTIQLVAIDVTALVQSRLQAEELAWELAEEQELYRAAFTDAPVGIAHLDLKGRVTEANDRLLDLFNTTREEFLLSGFEALTHPDDPQKKTPWSLDQLSDRSRTRVEKLYLTADGSTIWTSITVSLVRDRTAQPQRFIAIVEDVSPLKRANQDLEESSRSKDEFLAMLGHELRNPLAALRHASTVLSEHNMASEMKRVVNMVDRQTRHIGRLVDDLLDVGRIARGKFDFRDEQVDMRQIVSFALDDLEGARAPSQGLTVDLDEGPLWIRGDSARLLQACQNILNNATKYTPPDGHVEVRLAAGEDEIELSVTDDGVGLEPEFAKKLFLPFEQEPQDLSRSQGGLGLGLALTSQIVKHHGGTVNAESPGRGQGSVFTIRLPKTARAPSQATPRKALPRRRLRFLVIEDNRDAAELLEMLLASRGHEATLCYSGDVALETALSQKPDVVLCDLGLPGLSGFEVAEQLSHHDQLSDVHLIALSGYGRPEDIEQAKASGFVAHLTKPADVNEILGLLDQLGVMDSKPPRPKGKQ